MTNLALPSLGLLPLLTKSVPFIPIIDDLWVSSGDDCPELCSCQNEGKIVDCSNAGYQTLPDLPENVENLNLDNNDFRWLDASTTDFSMYENLTQVSIYNNAKLSGISETVFSNNLKLQEVYLQQSGIKNFGGVHVPDLKVLDVYSNVQESFDMDAFVEANKMVNSENEIKLNFGGNSLVSVKAESKFSMINDFVFNIVNVSDLGEFDVSKMLSKFPNAREFAMSGYQKDSFNLASLTCSHPFYENLKSFSLVGFSDVSSFLKLPKAYLPENLSYLNIQYCLLRDDHISKDFIGNFQHLNGLNLDSNLLTKAPF